MAQAGGLADGKPARRQDSLELGASASRRSRCPRRRAGAPGSPHRVEPDRAERARGERFDAVLARGRATRERRRRRARPAAASSTASRPRDGRPSRDDPTAAGSDSRLARASMIMPMSLARDGAQLRRSACVDQFAAGSPAGSQRRRRTRQRCRGCVGRLELQRGGVDAVALAVGPGPSSKTWPRWPPQVRQRTSVRRMNRLLSGRSSTASATARLGEARPAGAGVELRVAS